MNKIMKIIVTLLMVGISVTASADNKPTTYADGVKVLPVILKHCRELEKSIATQHIVAKTLHTYRDSYMKHCGFRIVSAKYLKNWGWDNTTARYQSVFSSSRAKHMFLLALDNKQSNAKKKSTKRQRQKQELKRMKKNALNAIKARERFEKRRAAIRKSRRAKHKAKK